VIADAYCINSWLTQVFGLVNTSGRKDFEVFWESPWTEEHVQDAPKKRKLEAQQRSMAVRSYIRASSMQQEQHDVGKFIETVDQLTQWEVIARALSALRARAAAASAHCRSRLIKSFAGPPRRQGQYQDRVAHGAEF
jgi:hypothetical protein